MGDEQQRLCDLALEGHSGKLRVLRAPARGRGLYTEVARQAGELLLRTEPYVAVLSTKLAGSRCSCCYREAQKLQRCSACKFARYCSAGCQTAAWQMHKIECSCLQRLSASSREPTDSVLLMARLLVRWAAEETAGSVRSRLRPLIAPLSVSKTSFRSDLADQSAEQLKVFAAMAALVNDFCPPPLRRSVDQLVELFCRFRCNNFSISDWEMRTVGAGLYPVAALINHSCKPNCVAVFDGPRVSIRALRPLAAQEELTLTYVEVLSSTLERRAALQESWCFRCECPLCAETSLEGRERDRLLLTYSCLEPSCGRAPLEPLTGGRAGELRCGRCSQCYLEADLRADVQQLLGRLSSSRASDSSPPASLLELLQARFAFPEALVPVRAWDHACRQALEHAQWAWAARACERVLRVFERVYLPGWPLTGLQFGMLGKLQEAEGRWTEAGDALAHAAELLQRTHGGDCPLVRELLEWAHEAKQDAFLAGQHAQQQAGARKMLPA